jgi:hypothetical protein
LLFLAVMATEAVHLALAPSRSQRNFLKNIPSLEPSLFSIAQHQQQHKQQQPQKRATREGNGRDAITCRYDVICPSVFGVTVD